MQPSGNGAGAEIAQFKFPARWQKTANVKIENKYKQIATIASLQSWTSFSHEVAAFLASAWERSEFVDENKAKVLFQKIKKPKQNSPV